MENSSLHFFCDNCKNPTHRTDPKSGCEIEYHAKEFKRGKYIAYQGKKVTHIHMLSQGRVKTDLLSSSGHTFSINEQEAPYPLAVPFLFADHNYFPFDIIALEPCQILYISRSTVERLIHTCPEFMRSFMVFNANITKQMAIRMKILSQKNLKAKFAYYVISQNKGEEFELNRSITMLAQYLSVDRSSLSRVISDMVRNNIITFKSGRIQIIDKELFESTIR